jgi:N-methylhydantoinase A
MRLEGFEEDALSITRSSDFRFLGQVYELTMRLPNRELTADDGPRLFSDFHAMYERVYGEGTAWKGTPAQLLTYTVTGSARHAPPSAASPPDLQPRPDHEIQRSSRRVYVPSHRAFATLPIYDGDPFTPGSRVAGPAIIDESDTTIFVPADFQAARDELLNYRLGLSEAHQPPS